MFCHLSCWLWWIMYNRTRRSGDIVGLTRDLIASSSLYHAEHSILPLMATVSVKPLFFHHICSKVANDHQQSITTDCSFDRITTNPGTTFELLAFVLFVASSRATSLLLQTMHHQRYRVIWLELHGQRKRYEQQRKWKIECRWNGGAR